MIKILLSGLLFFFACCQIATAQSSQYDLETWSSVGLKYELAKKWNIQANNQLRLDRLSTTLNSNITQLELSYKINKQWDLRYEFRFIADYDSKGSDKGLTYYMRNHWEVEEGGRAGRLLVEYRYRFQWKHRLGGVDQSLEFDAFDHRLRLALGYDIKGWKLDPKLSVESFYHRQRGELNGFNRYRVMLSSSRKLTDQSKLKLKIGMNRKRSVWQPKTDLILGLGYVYEI